MKDSATVGQPPELLSQPQAILLVGISRSAWHRQRAAGHLPKPVRLPGTVRPLWRRQDLIAYLNALPTVDS